MRELALLWLLTGCPPEPPARKDLGAVCDYDGQCVDKLRCVGKTCQSQQAFEQNVLQQAGVATDATEAPPPPEVTGTPIRIRTATGGTPVFAACAADERLIGGGCSGGNDCGGQHCAYLRSYPSSPDPADTIGGRWNCAEGRGELTAHALCQRAATK